MIDEINRPAPIFCIYVYRDPRPGKCMQPFYIGKGNIKNGRAFKHLRFGSKNPLFSRILKKIKETGVEPAVEIIATFADEDEAFTAECDMIRKYGRRDLGTGCLANLTDGGEGNSKPSAEKRRKLAEAAKAFFTGKPKTKEHREKIALKNKGKTVSPEAIAKSRAANIGRRATDLARANMSAAGRGKRKSAAWVAKATAWLHNPETNAKRKAGAATPEARAKMSAASRAYWDNRAARAGKIV